MFAEHTLGDDIFAIRGDGRHTVPRFPECRPLGRLVLTASGAYTMTNHRRFNRIQPPTGYPFGGGSDSVVPTKERLWPLSLRNP
ncbi:hypothetical protein ACIQC7_38450 [Kitasatospora sp. NPDC088556]|uniref:hypothetical protein n=1 Tax=Kitasatospora sp. NPDC088556 TaxID=3364076 RepID=UPI0038145EE9